MLDALPLLLLHTVKAWIIFLLKCNLKISTYHLFKAFTNLNHRIFTVNPLGN